MWPSLQKSMTLANVSYRGTASPSQHAKLLLMGFNREEAAKHFELYIETHHEQSDFELAFAHWGVAYCNGADYNMYGKLYEKLRESDEWPSLETARAHAKKAAQLRHLAPPAWGHIFEATVLRFETLDLHTYADRMATDFERDKEEMDALAIAVHAESRMILQPWNLWNRDTMKPTENATLAHDRLAFGLQKYPTNPWLCHLMVHYAEMGPKDKFPSDAVLRPLESSDNGHLVHMPTHIYIQQGRYTTSRDLNMKAVELDAAARETKKSSLSIYAFYECHNMHFVTFASCMCGDVESAVEYSHRLESFVWARLREANDVSKLLCEGFLMIRPMVYVRFGKWDEILAHSDSHDASSNLVSTLFFAYAKSIAFAARGSIDEAKREKKAFDELRKDERVQQMILHNQDLPTICELAALVASAEILYREMVMGKNENTEWDQQLKRAMDVEDGLAYDEPPPWMIPVRQTLSALLMEQGRAEEALVHARADLDKWPQNLWSSMTVNHCHERLKLPGRIDLTALTDADVSSFHASCACATTMF